MDAVTARAVEDYHRLLGDDPIRLAELAAPFFERLRGAGLTFGGRLLSPFLRPGLVSEAQYRQICVASRLVFEAVCAVEARLGAGLWDRVDLTPLERELAGLGPPGQTSSPTARLDSFLTASAFQFVELNAEAPAGIAYDEVLAELFLELAPLRHLQERYVLTRFRSRERLLETLLACHRQAGGGSAVPNIAIVDYDDVPTRTEHHLFREFFESRGCPALVCDPRRLDYAGGRLRHEGRVIDVVYRRLLVNELLDRSAEVRPLLDAVRDGAVTMVNPFRCKAIHKKAIFAVLTDDDVLPLLSPEQRRAVAAHVPWTRRVAHGAALRHGRRIDLPAFIRSSRSTLVLKPNDEYGGKGVFLGWELSESQWDAALDQALAGSYVVQERVELARQTFPEAAPEPRFRDLVVDLDPFLFDGEVEGMLMRLSGTSLANVTSGGGQVPAFLVTPR